MTILGSRFALHSARSATAILSLVLLATSLPHTSSFGVQQALAQRIEDQSLNVLWSREIADNDRVLTSPTLVLRDLLNAPNRPILLLVRQDNQLILSEAPSAPGIGQVIPLQTGAQPSRLSSGNDNSLWLGGIKNDRYSGIAPTRYSEAYLAKVDKRGAVEWERAFGQGRQRTAESISALPSGGVMVSGRDGDTTWLARIGDDGGIVWERFFGAGAASSVITHNDRVLVAAVTRELSGRASIGLWIFDTEGQIIRETAIRADVGSATEARSVKINLIRHQDGIFAFTESQGLRSVAPTEVVRLAADGIPMWRRVLPDTLTMQGTRQRLCPTAQAVLDDGTPIVSCSLGNTIALLKLDQHTGAEARIEVNASPLFASCRAPSLPRFLVRRTGERLRLLGSPLDEPGRANCAWIAEIAE